MKVKSPVQQPPPVNNEKQRYFQTQEKLKAITRIKAGESHGTVARSLGIPPETLCEWISSLAQVDWNRGIRGSSTLNHDLLDRALYTWFIQQLRMDLRPTKDLLKKKAEVFSTRLYGCYDGIVSDLWIERWQGRHHIKEKLMEEFQQDSDLILVDELQHLTSREDDAKENEKICYECDFNLEETIDTFLRKDYTKLVLERSFNLLKMKFDELTENATDIDKILEDSKKRQFEVRVGLLNTFGKEYGLVNGLSAALGSVQNGKAEGTNDVVHIGQKSLERQNLPPFGPIERKKIHSGMEVFAMKTDLLGIWIRAVVTEIIPENSETNYNTWDMFKVKFKVNKKPCVKPLSAKQLAYATRPQVTLPVGTRIIAQYKDETSPQLNAMYAGIIAEPPKITNNQRYLIFFDDGYAQYVRHHEVFLVCESSKEVWKDIHKDSQDYIKSYLERYPERPMVKLQKKQVVKIEWNGAWWSAIVLGVDASLVHMYFESDRRTEWIYRGSTRLAPLYNELIAKDENRVTAKVRRTYLKRKHQPYVEYTTGIEEQSEKDADAEGDGYQTARKHTRNTARKSTTMDSESSLNAEETLQVTRQPLPSRMISQEGITTTDKLSVTSVPEYIPHRCCSLCNVKEEEPTRGQNPLRIPMLCGWLRLIVKQRGKKVVCYVAPCGRRLRNVGEVFRFLTRTKSRLGIDLFSFDFCVHPFSQFKPTGILTYIKDITYGKEPVPVCLVNNLSKEYPPPVAYSSTRFPREGVVINTDPEFLCGCDCEDNCQNKEKCQCQQLTVQATAACASGKIEPTAGYEFRRLVDPLATGVYECNTRCKCKSTCLNRVVQNGLQVRLQVFKTERRGWGIRCLDDLPQGIFICIYAGQLSNEEGAQVDGRECGDEYQAELDHIEVVEAMKAGYESDVEDIEADGSSKEESEDSDKSSDDETPDQLQLPKPAAYESDSDYDPPGKWGATGATSDRKRRCQSRLSSKDSDSSNASNDNFLKAFTQKQKAAKTDEFVKPGKSKLDLAFDKLLGPNNVNGGVNGTKNSINSEASAKNSSDSTSRKKSSTAVGGSESDVKDSKEDSGDQPKPLRSYFGEEYCYIMDAKKRGNIGRYLNHSCHPNVFVQNVFVDTHDLRFPWVAFFASVYIRGGTELTWDYNYDVGSVPGKVLQCYCGAKGCRQRLL